MISRVLWCTAFLTLLVFGANGHALANGVTTFGSCSIPSPGTCNSGDKSITLGTTPSLGQTFLLCVLGQSSAPSLSGTWTTIGTSSTNKSYCYDRAVASGDTGSATVTVTTTALAGGAVLYELSGVGSISGFSSATATDPGGDGGVTIDPSTSASGFNITITMAIDFVSGDGSDDIDGGYPATQCSVADATNPTAPDSASFTQVASGNSGTTVDNDCDGGIAFQYASAVGRDETPTLSTAYAAVVAVTYTTGGTYQPLQVVGDPFWPLY